MTPCTQCGRMFEPDLESGIRKCARCHPVGDFSDAPPAPTFPVVSAPGRCQIPGCTKPLVRQLDCEQGGLHVCSEHAPSSALSPVALPLEAPRSARSMWQTALHLLQSTARHVSNVSAIYSFCSRLYNRESIGDMHDGFGTPDSGWLTTLCIDGATTGVTMRFFWRIWQRWRMSPEDKHFLNPHDDFNDMIIAIFTVCRFSGQNRVPFTGLSSDAVGVSSHFDTAYNGGLKAGQFVSRLIAVRDVVLGVGQLHELCGEWGRVNIDPPGAPFGMGWKAYLREALPEDLKHTDSADGVLGGLVGSRSKSEIGLDMVLVTFTVLLQATRAFYAGASTPWLAWIFAILGVADFMGFAVKDFSKLLGLAKEAATKILPCWSSGGDPGSYSARLSQACGGRSDRLLTLAGRIQADFDDADVDPHGMFVPSQKTRTWLTFLARFEEYKAARSGRPVDCAGDLYDRIRRLSPDLNGDARVRFQTAEPMRPAGALDFGALGGLSGTLPQASPLSAASLEGSGDEWVFRPAALAANWDAPFIPEIHIDTEGTHVAEVGGDGWCGYLSIACGLLSTSPEARTTHGQVVDKALEVLRNVHPGHAARFTRECYRQYQLPRNLMLVPQGNHQLLTYLGMQNGGTRLYVTVSPAAEAVDMAGLPWHDVWLDTQREDAIRAGREADEDIPDPGYAYFINLYHQGGHYQLVCQYGTAERYGHYAGQPCHPEWLRMSPHQQYFDARPRSGSEETAVPGVHESGVVAGTTTPRSDSSWSSTGEGSPRDGLQESATMHPSMVAPVSPTAVDRVHSFSVAPPESAPYGLSAEF